MCISGDKHFSEDYIKSFFKAIKYSFMVCFKIICKEHMQVKIYVQNYVQKGLLFDPLCHSTTSMMSFFFFFIPLIFFLLNFICGTSSLEGRHRGTGDEWN